MARDPFMRLLVQDGFPDGRAAQASGIHYRSADHRQIAGNPHEANVSIINADAQSDLRQNSKK
jgi:hypothetical protein